MISCVTVFLIQIINIKIIIKYFTKLPFVFTNKLLVAIIVYQVFAWHTVAIETSAWKNPPLLNIGMAMSEKAYNEMEIRLEYFDSLQAEKIFRMM